MKIIDINIPKDRTLEHRDPTNLDDEIRDIIDPNLVETVLYEYEHGYYEGYGNMLLINKDGLIALNDLSHCSCFGPFEYLHYGFESYQDLKKSMSEGYQDNLKELFKLYEELYPS